MPDIAGVVPKDANAQDTACAVSGEADAPHMAVAAVKKADVSQLTQPLKR